MDIDLEVSSNKRIINLLEVRKHFQNSLLSIFHTNIRSLYKNFNELQILLNHLNVNFDIIALSETWKLDGIEYLNLTNYESLYNLGDINKNDGAVVFIKSTLTYNSEIITIGNLKCIRICIYKKPKHFYVTVLYRLPSINIENFNIKFNSYLDQHCIYENEIIVGDTNINILKTTDVHVAEYLNNLYSHGFNSYINEYTREENDSKTCIDHIFVKTKINKTLLNSLILETTITDHYSIALNINTNKPVNNNTIITNRVKKLINFNYLKQSLSNEKWESLEKNIDDVNYLTNAFLETIKYHIAKCSYVKVTKQNKRKQWITLEIIELINRRNALYQKYKRNRSNLALEEYRKLRNKITKLIKNTKNNYYRNKIEENPKDPKFIWKIINNSFNKDKNVKPKIKEIMVHGKQISQNDEIADAFNNYFANVAEVMANEIQCSTNNANFNEKTCTNTIFLKPVDSLEIEKYIHELNINTAAGLDNLTPKILREINEYISPILANIINTSFLSGICPDHFKISYVTPVYKTGDKSSLSNYRPISVISNIGKVFEKALKSRLLNFIEKNNIICNTQFGFRNNKSTQDAIAFLTNFLYKQVDNSDPVIAVFLDLAKAFDTVSHKLLLQKLQRVGIRGKAYELIKNYLYNRKQHVKIENSLSKTVTIKHGVPQGTVLGPLLFLLYINDLLYNEFHCKLLSYADDTIALFTDLHWDNLKHKTAAGLSKIKAWMDSNLLSVNFKKTSFMPFVSYQNHLPNYVTIKIHNYNCKGGSCNCSFIIRRSENIKYLGILLDCNLKWNNHINLLIKRLRSFLYVFKQLRDFLPINILKQVYYALIEPQLSYGIIAWGGSYKSTLKCLEIMQRYVLKIMFYKKIKYNSNVLYNEAKVMNIRQLYCKSLLQFVYKNYSIVTCSFHEHQYYTKNKAKINHNIPQFKKTIGLRSYQYFAIKMYNILPPEIKNEKHYKKFIIKIKDFIMENRDKINEITN